MIKWCTVPEIWCATERDGQTDRWKKWHIEVGAPPKKDTKALMQQPNAFLRKYQQRFALCKYWDDFIDLTSMLHNLISADRERDWEGHLQVIQDLVFFGFFEDDCINYLQYATWCLEKIQRLNQQHPDIHQGSTNYPHSDERVPNMHAKMFLCAWNYLHVNQSKHF